MRKAAHISCLLGGAASIAAALAFFGPDHTPSGAVEPRSSLPGQIARDQTYLRTRPQDARIWARLGTAYVEQARRTGDPAYHPKAQGALERSLHLKPVANADALTGMGALDTARHEFVRARGWALKAQRIDPYRPGPYGVLTDAAIELGDYTGAENVLERMLRLRPGTASFARAARLLELRGRSSRAEEALRRALDAAGGPAEIAYCHFRLGELAWRAGRAEQAHHSYDQALAADPGYAPALAGRARALAGLGRTNTAIAGYTAALAHAPLPQLLVELGELHQSQGNAQAAKGQFALLKAQHRLLQTDDLALGRYESDHGDAHAAVRLLTGEWRRRRGIEVADALGWALHRAGRSREALPYLRRAGRLGGADALRSFHRGEIERALGHRAAARHHLTRALSINPVFSPLRAKQARKHLAELGER